MEEIPPRFPYANSKYTINAVSENDLNLNNIGALQFPIAKFKNTLGVYEILGDFIPPCLTVNSHQNLIKLFEIYDMFFKQTEFHAVQIIQKIKLEIKTKTKM